MPLDILMTILSVILMGGTMFFPDDRIHQICGTVNKIELTQKLGTVVFKQSKK